MNFNVKYYLSLLTLLGAMAMMAVEAGAESSGHFTWGEPPTTTFTGTESTSDFAHKIEFSASALPGNPIYCKNASFHRTAISDSTAQAVEITPTYSECTTTGAGTPNVTVTFGQCKYLATSRNTSDATAGLSCPAGEKVVVHDSGTGCILRFGTQHIANAVAYKTTTFSEKHALTVEVTASKISFTAHGGLCSFIGTSQTEGNLLGAVTMHAIDIATEAPVDLTAT